MAKKKSKKKKFQENQILEQDENYYYIAGYTSAGFPYGVTWEEARKDDLIDDGEHAVCCIVVIDFLTKEIIEKKYVSEKDAV